MAKRRAEDTLLHDSPSKRCYRSLCGVELQLGGTAPAGGVSPPSLLALLGGRSRKRPYYFEEPEEHEALHRKATHCEARKHAASVQTSGSFLDRRSSGAVTSSKKRGREGCTDPERAPREADDKADTNTEDSTYNSFQYWRLPLPELDLSLLEDTSQDNSQAKDGSKVKDSSSDAMET